jgi:hypothetical protein
MRLHEWVARDKGYFDREGLDYKFRDQLASPTGVMHTGDPEPDDVRKYFRALRAAQRDIDLRPELYTHFYKEEFPPRFRDEMDTGRWGPGERLVFEPYTREVYAESFDWIAKHGIFPEGGMGAGNYDEAVYAG